MSDGYRDLHGDAYDEWRDGAADEFAEIQRRAFKAGFEAAADESAAFRHLREWLEEQRDEANYKYDERDSDAQFGRSMAFKEVLVKLSEMGCQPTAPAEPPEDDEHDVHADARDVDGLTERLVSLDMATLTNYSHVPHVEAKILFAPDNTPEEWGENIEMALEDTLSDLPTVIEVSTTEWPIDTTTDHNDGDSA